jgi:hypothetical protein
MKKINSPTIALLITIFIINIATAMQSHNSLMLSSLQNAQEHRLVLHGINTIQSLKDNIKTALQLRQSCMYLNAFLSLKLVGQSFHGYKQKEKDAALKQLLTGMNDFNYWTRRCAALMLIHAGANNAVNKDYSLLERAVHREDIEAITILFENNTNPNQAYHGKPIFFQIKTLDIAKKFITQKINIDAQDLPSYPNVLWHNIFRHCSAELFKLYLHCGADIKKTCPYNGSLLHVLVQEAYRYHNDDYITIAKLLLTAVPDMISMANEKGKTPLDLAKAIVDEFNFYNHNGIKIGNNEKYTVNVKLIELFEEHNNKIALQLKNEKLKPMHEQKAYGDCIICFEDKRENMMAVRCHNVHSDRICTDCYNGLPKLAQQCPVCREVLK